MFWSWSTGNSLLCSKIELGTEGPENLGRLHHHIPAGHTCWRKYYGDGEVVEKLSSLRKSSVSERQAVLSWKENCRLLAGKEVLLSCHLQYLPCLLWCWTQWDQAFNYTWVLLPVFICTLHAFSPFPYISRPTIPFPPVKALLLGVFWKGAVCFNYHGSSTPSLITNSHCAPGPRKWHCRQRCLQFSGNSPELPNLFYFRYSKLHPCPFSLVRHLQPQRKRQWFYQSNGPRFARVKWDFTSSKMSKSTKNLPTFTFLKRNTSSCSQKRLQCKEVSDASHILMSKTSLWPMKERGPLTPLCAGRTARVDVTCPGQKAVGNRAKKRKPLPDLQAHSFLLLALPSLFAG